MCDTDGRMVAVESGSVNRIGFKDLGFQRIPVPAQSSRGTPFTRWIPFGMPRIPPDVLKCVCYLYATEKEAETGKGFGGTGFVVTFPSRFSDSLFVYVVTNHHVACSEGASVVRLNTIDGATDIYPFEPDQWHFDPRYDVAVHPINVHKDRHNISVIHNPSFLTKEMLELRKIGAGDDVFMVGRFVDHDGGSTNQPAVRFGNISVMPSPIKQPNGLMADAFCIDLHSRSGYSGSPVFVYRTPGNDLEEQPSTDPNRLRLLAAGTHFFCFAWYSLRAVSGTVGDCLRRD